MSKQSDKIPIFLALCVFIIGCSLLVLERTALKTGFAVAQVEVANAPPTQPQLVSPENNSQIYEINSTFSFLWINSVDANNDPISYNFMLATDVNFTAAVENASGINETFETTNYTPSITYVHSDYYWQVRGFDNESYGNWSEFFKFRYCIGNNAPAIAAIGVITLYEGDSFYYRVIAADSDNDAITFSDNSPLFEINSTSGLINFKTASLGTFVITIIVDDLCNATHEIFVLNVLSKSLRPPRNSTNEGGGGGGSSPVPAPPEKKNETKNETEVTELTPEESIRFSRAQIIYIGNFKDQSIFNVTMYEGPIWFFTYEGSNYFLTLTPLEGESMFIGFFEGPGFKFKKQSETLADINKNGLPEIKIGYINRTGGNYSIVLEALKKPEKQFPMIILNASKWGGIAMLIILLGFSIFLAGKKVIRDAAKGRDPLKITRQMSSEKGIYKIELCARNVGPISLYNLRIDESIPASTQVEGEIEIEKDASTELEKNLDSDTITLKIAELTSGKEIRMTYQIKQQKKPELLRGTAGYQIKIMDTYVDFSKRYM